MIQITLHLRGHLKEARHLVSSATSNQNLDHTFHRQVSLKPLTIATAPLASPTRLSQGKPSNLF